MLLLLGATIVSIPAGSFRMGSDRAPDESPGHDVALSAYRIDAEEVSVAAYAAFVAAGGYTDSRHWSPEGQQWLAAHPEGAGAGLRSSDRSGEHPVVAVTWYEADAYCRWKGGSLPTEAQWEYAACGGRGTRYPWGDDEQIDAAWFTEGKTGQLTSVNTRPVNREDARATSPHGLRHAVGTVWEWTLDSYHSAFYAKSSPQNPRNDEATPWRTLRGGGFDNLPSYCTCTHREPALPAEPRLTTGFRCAYPAEGP